MAGTSDAPHLLTRGRRVEITRIAVVGLVTLFHWAGVAPLAVLLVAVGVGLYPLARLGFHELVHDHRIGTEIFVTVATIIALLGREYIAGSVLVTIILIAEFIADLNTDRARASI